MIARVVCGKGARTVKVREDDELGVLIGHDSVYSGGKRTYSYKRCKVCLFSSPVGGGGGGG